jgi:tetrapyrrole methylase family protein/MazG family protein
VTAGRVVVVGLGPAGADLVVPAGRAAIERIPVRFARTARHPAVAELVADGFAFHAFDDRYDRAASLDDAYTAIADALVEAAADEGEVLYAVPGSPAIGERSVALLADAPVDLVIIPGLSFADLAWSRLGIDPMTSGAVVVDGRDLRDVPPRPLLVAQCDRPEVLADVKLELLDAGVAPDAPVVVLSHLGLADESIATVPLAELDRVVPDHLTALSVDASRAAGGVASSFVRFVELVERLRGPGGCPWDAEQTHHSLTRHVVEEAYEVAEAIAALPVWAPGPAPAGEPVDAAAYAELEEELGDLLFQVVFHATLAREAGAFTMAEVAQGIHDKLVRRHPHVFGDVEVTGAAHVVRNWEQIKRAEKGRASVMEGIPGNLPALQYTQKVLRKAAALGVEIGDRAAGTVDEESIGDALASVVALAHAAGIDSEVALRGWAARLRDRVESMERHAAERGESLDTLSRAEVAALWDKSGP